MEIRQEGFEVFRRGTFGNAGANLFVDAKGIIRRISDQDLNCDGNFDIVFPNSHGYIERGPTAIYRYDGSKWKEKLLPHDSCWKSYTVDIDGDGYPDLLIANGENGVTSDLTSYIYWGGPDGLTGEKTEFRTEGAYSAAVVDLTGTGKKDIVFSSAWHDHHFPGYDFAQKVFVQESPRKFRDATEEYHFIHNTIMNVASADLTNDGFDSLIMAGYKSADSPFSKLYIYYGGEDGIASSPVELPVYLCTGIRTYDVFGTGYNDIILTGGNRVTVFRNRSGRFSSEDVLTIEVKGARTQFFSGSIGFDIADLDGDGINEIIIGTALGIEIRKISDPDKVWQSIEGIFVSGVCACDLYHTGRPDIVAAVYSSVKSYDTDSFIFHNTNNRYSMEESEKIETHGAVSVNVSDIDNDGMPEIIFCNTMYGPNQRDPEFPVYCYYGSDDNVFREENRVEYPVDSGAYSYTSGDVDNDGYPELIVTTWNGARIFKGTENGPDPKNWYDIRDPNLRIPGGLILADLNHTGWLDLILSCSAKVETGLDAATIFFGGPDGYSNDRCVAVHADLSCAQALVLCDVDGDGYLDLVFGERTGELGILYGSADGLDPNQLPEHVSLKNANGAELMGVTAADVNGDGKLEIITTSAGHYTRRKSYLDILKNAEKGFPMEEQVSFETGGTTGYVSFADLRHSGSLDMIVPFYSTTETRVLPMRIFKNDGCGNYNFDDPLKIECESSIASLPVDLDRNGYPDLLVCCHRNDLGHTVQSVLFHNGPEGIELEKCQKLWAYGPHDFTRNCIYNIVDRSESEYYTSEILEVAEVPKSIVWDADCKNGTCLKMRIRTGRDMSSLLSASYSSPVENGSALSLPEDTAFVQYQAEFFAPNACGSPKLRSVSIK